ncbi:MAG: DUF465 domain-containing protein [Pseudomonadota bacterium]
MKSSGPSIAENLAELKSEHRDLDDAIIRLSADPNSDQMQITRLKKRKLRLRDQITYWESHLIPDLDA